jgi:hypothetical protein
VGDVAWSYSRYMVGVPYHKRDQIILCLIFGAKASITKSKTLIIKLKPSRAASPGRPHFSAEIKLFYFIFFIFHFREVG